VAERGARAAGRGARRSLAQVRADAKECHACDLDKRATQTVFGEGPSSALSRKET